MQVYFIRHAQAEHNVSGDYNILDPAITDKGIQQCELKHYPRMRLILCSTSQRAIQTAQLLFPNDKIYASGLFLEHNTGVPCNTPSPLSVQQQRFPQVDFDTYFCPPLPVETTFADGHRRAERIFEFLRQLQIKGDVAIISHANIIHALGHTGEELGNCEAYMTTVCRIY